MSDLALLNGSLSSTGLRLHDPDLPYEEFEKLCVHLGEQYAMVRGADMALRFAIGDAILAGEEMYGERSYQAFEAFNLSHEILKESARIAGAIPHSLRTEAVKWSNYRAVAAQPYERRAEWLKRVAIEGLSHHELRAAIAEDREGEGNPAAALTPPSRCECCGRPL